MKVLVLGASENRQRYANIAIRDLLRYNHEVLAIGRREGEVAGVEIETTLKPFENVHTVTLYLGPQNQPPYYRYIKELKPKRVIFNPGTENPSFQQELEAHGIEATVACTLVLLRVNDF
jgi:predicted CoA-binding protein